MCFGVQGRVVTADFGEEFWEVERMHSRSEVASVASGHALTSR
jgi:hypothetical protein